MLGNRCKCSGASLYMVEKSCPVTILSQYCFIRLRALCREVCCSKRVMSSSLGHLSEQLNLAKRRKQMVIPFEVGRVFVCFGVV